MMITKSHKIQLETTPEHDRIFTSWCGVARWAYNRGIERKRESYKSSGKSPRAYALMTEIVALKQAEEYAWLNDTPKSIPRMALLQLDEAYGHLFRRAKKGEAKKGVPKFKSKKRSKPSFHLEPGSIAVNGKHVRIPKLGRLRMHQAIRFEGKLVGTVCISKSAGKWYASFAVETEIPDPNENQVGQVVGLDVGVKKLATLSDGSEFENPKAFSRLEQLLARTQRQITRKQAGSRRWQKAKLRVQKIHKRIADLRASATHQVSAYVAKNCSGVAIEDLNVNGMVKNHNLAKAVLDANFRELHRQLRYKMLWSGGEVRQVERFFPSSKLCHACGLINDSLTLADREWTCECGTHHNRDVNAAINLAKRCWPGVDGCCAGTDRRSHAPDEPRTTFVDRTKKGVLHDLAI
ncbi:MAG: IS200/IS605 family element transposase accessory protein TnpB [Candidatus Tectomicrobia bacterium]|nr:IS200/IS605 family element transposase accessory protein TnpB [Candidatus Tectomicrobia bacterium]